MRCAVTGTPYTVFGYDGKQVRDNIHSNDVVSAFEAFVAAPRAAAVYNLGGGRESNVSMLRGDRRVRAHLGPDAGLDAVRRGADGRSPLVDLGPVGLPARLSGVELRYDLETTLREIHDANVERWTQRTSRSRPVSTS